MRCMVEGTPTSSQCICIIIVETWLNGDIPNNELCV